MKNLWMSLRNCFFEKFFEKFKLKSCCIRKPKKRISKSLTLKYSSEFHSELFSGSKVNIKKNCNWIISKQNKNLKKLLHL